MTFYGLYMNSIVIHRNFTVKIMFCGPESWKNENSEMLLGYTVMWNGESSPNSITKNISDRQFDARIFDKLNLKIVFPKIAQKRQNMTKIEIKFPNFCSAINDFFHFLLRRAI